MLITDPTSGQSSLTYERGNEPPIFHYLNVNKFHEIYEISPRT